MARAAAIGLAEGVTKPQTAQETGGVTGIRPSRSSKGHKLFLEDEKANKKAEMMLP